jgi:hypothetical protein
MSKLSESFVCMAKPWKDYQVYGKTLAGSLHSSLWKKKCQIFLSVAAGSCKYHSFFTSRIK